MADIELRPNGDGSYGPTPSNTFRINPDAEDAQGPRSRATSARTFANWTSKVWMFGAFSLYFRVFGPLIAMYVINHQFEWNGMIFNMIIFILLALWLLPVLSLPVITTATTIAGLAQKDVPKALRAYYGSVMPFLVFWSLLAAGAMAAFPWHMGPLWAVVPVAGGSIIAGVHWWRYQYETNVVQTISRWYILGVIIVGVGFALGLDKPVGNWIESINPPTAFSQDSTTVDTNWSMDSETGEVFKTLSPTECAELEREFCINPDTGVKLIKYNLDEMIRLRSQLRTSSNVRPAPPLTPPRLTTAEFEDQTYGKFERMQIAPGANNRVGPITNFSGDSLCHTQAGGTGRLVVWSRADFTSEPVRATMARDGINIASFGHLGAPWQLFYGAEGGTATLLFERKDRPDAC